MPVQRALRTMKMLSHPASGAMPRPSGGDWRRPPITKSLGGGGLGEGAFFKTAAGSRNQISRRLWSVRMAADGGVSRFHNAEERPVALCPSC